MYSWLYTDFTALTVTQLISYLFVLKYKISVIFAAVGEQLLQITYTNVIFITIKIFDLCFLGKVGICIKRGDALKEVCLF